MPDYQLPYQRGRQAPVANTADYLPAPAGGGSTTTAADSVDSTTTGAMTSASPADGGSFTVASATGFPTPPSTTLAAALGSAAGVLTLTSAAGFDEAGELLIGTERIAYGYRDGVTVKALVRGVGGTTVADHSLGATVYGTEQVTVDREVIAYHTLSGTTLGAIARPSPVAHDSGAVCAPAGVDLELTSTSGFPASGLVRLGGAEVVSYASIDGTTLEGVVRGLEGTTPQAWSSGSTAVGVAYRQSGRGDVLMVPNGAGSDIARGTMVGWQGGTGVEPLAEGEPMTGVAAGTLLANGWGPVRTAGVLALSLDSSYSTEPAPCEPVFAVSGTTVKALADADDGDQAVGYCLRVHDVDLAGDALTDVLVDFVMVSQLAAPFVYVAP